jgi:glycosyltransferase involved in cell wall biosynthesis
MNWICSQIGAREHYAVPRALHQGGRLAAFYTDFWTGHAVRKLTGGSRGQGGKQKMESRNFGPAFKALHPLAARYHSELEKTENGKRKAEIVSWNSRALWWEWQLRRRAKVGEHYLGYIEVGQQFSVRVREALKRRSDVGSDSIFFSYDTGALEAMEWCREKGIRSVLNQMDPNRVEVELVREEEKRWSNWTEHSTAVPEEYFQRREQEWALADRVVVNSEFSRQALMKQGVSPEKIVVIPLCYEAEETNRKSEIGNRESEPSTLNSQLSTKPLRVLFLGQVILRKGIQYLIEAAKLLRDEPVHFDVVGSTGISEEAVKSAPANMTFHGRANRDEAGGWYERADVFVLPTLSDGFAITQLEAMAHGLPVVTTSCCGDVVSDGVDGFIVPARDAGTLAKTLQRYLTERTLLKDQQTAALMKAGQFTLNRLADNLRRLEQLL